MLAATENASKNAGPVGWPLAANPVKAGGDPGLVGAEFERQGIAVGGLAALVAPSVSGDDTTC